MKRILATILVFTPAIASADKTFLTGKGTTWDCKKDPTVSIMHGNGTYVFKGACKQININGGHNTLKIETIDELNVNGGHNTIDVSVRAKQINLNGSDNTITTKGDKPAVNIVGSNNSVNGGGMAGAPTKPADDDDDDKAASGSMIDCSKQPDTSLVDNNANIVFTGACGKISVAGNDSQLKIEKVKTLSVQGNHNTIDVATASAVALPGNHNTINVVAVDVLSVAGNDNTVGWKKGATKPKPRVSVAGKKNKVAQVK